MKKIIGIFFLCCYVSSYTTETTFTKYYNARFNFQVSYPGFLIPQEEPANASGRVFIGKNSTLTVYGSFFPNLDSQQDEEQFNIKDEFNYEMKELNQKGFEVGYTLLKTNQFIITASNKNQIAYIKKIFVQPCGVHIFLSLFYPKKEKLLWDSLVTQISKSFKYSSQTCQGDYLTE